MEVIIKVRINRKIIHTVKRMLSKKNAATLAFLALLLWTLPAFVLNNNDINSLSTPLVIPHAFESGDIIDADSINSNFKTVYDKIQTVQNETLKKIDEKINETNSILDTYQQRIDGSISYLENGLIPSGMIAMYYGTGSAPAGWVICDGKNGTPDLRDKFVIGAETDNDDGTGKFYVGKQELKPLHQHGIIHKHTGFTKEGISSHSHEWLFLDNGSFSTYDSESGAPIALFDFHNAGGSEGTSFKGLKMLDIESTSFHTDKHVDNHKHAFTAGVDDLAIKSGHSDSLPPYCALYFIMKQ